MKKVLLLLALVGGFLSDTQAQTYFGLGQSNYGGVNSAMLNPGFMADNRLKVDVSVFGFSATGYNNHMYMNTRLMPEWWVKSFTDTTGAPRAWRDNPNFDKIVLDSVDYYRANGANFFTIDDDNLARKGYVNLEMDILNTMFSISRDKAVGFGIRHRTFVNIDHVAPEVLTLSVNSLEVPSLHDVDLSDQLLNLSWNSWMEYHVSYSQVVMDEEEHFVKVGGRLKLLQGLGSAFIHTDNVDYNFDNEDTAAYITGDFEYGYSDNLGRYVEPLGDEQGLSDLGSAADMFKDIYSFNSRAGIGIDIGGVYEWRPDHADYKYDMDGETGLWKRDQNKYKLRASFALNDIGGMRYTRGQLSRDFKMQANVLDMAVFDSVSGPRSFDSTIVALEGQGQLSFNDTDPTYKMGLPTNIYMEVDYHIIKDLYVNMSTRINLRSKKNSNKVHYTSHIALSPRYDYKWAGLALPMSYSQFMGFRMGASVRFGPFFIGTGDLKPLFAPGKDKDIRGADIYFAMKVPILHRHPRDRDNDKVSDKVEKKHRKEIRKESGDKKAEGCLEVPGVWEFKGCPDTDGDHIQDSKDSCVYDAGIPEFNGCPDTDGDKIMDKLDACPEDSGLVEFNGCPDTDGDKIIDKEDECVDVPGLAEFNGCPDTDKDGIKDSDDLCPEHPGPVENDGCPDKDEDGLLDFLDECPEVAGPKENNGCPWPDTDEDGLLDKDDKCPYNAGPKENEGCPYKDTDEDGVLDKDDECVNTPGPKENNGCPEIKEEEQEIINTAFENLLFKTGSDVIDESSYESLEGLAELLVKKDDWKLEIAGHTDNVGSANANLALSKKRATAVATFLNQRGVQMDRLIVKYFGEEKPIADNNTKEGREQNRRVEMTVLFE